MPVELATTDEDLADGFRRLRTGRDVAALLEVKYSLLTYHVYRRPLNTRYTQFTIRKKGGGHRAICAPVTTLKILQRKLNHILQLIYSPKPCVQGFVRGRSVLTNAQTHVRRTVILNIDLSDFFPSINFGRVRGMFMARPYKIPEKAATVLAQICCFDGHLPQGAPTSPIISNMICAKLDSELLHLARRFRCIYTRYADDITFSTIRNRLESSLAKVVEEDSSACAEVGKLLRSTIENNGFQINSTKVRIQWRGRRQEVTGLVVNKSPNVKRIYVRQIRAITHAIKKHGLDAAEREFHTRYCHRSARPRRELPPLEKVLDGKLSYLRMVKGEADPVYRRLFNRYQESLGNPPAYITEPHRDLPPSLWVLESQEPFSQGSAFMLRNIGLVTCAHVLRPKTKVFRCDHYSNQHLVKVQAKDEELDIAILAPPPGARASLEAGNPEAVQWGDTLSLAGFPNYRMPIDDPYITQGRVANFRIVHTLRWILLNTPIVAGNSGGPVLDHDGRVVGIAARGTDKMENAHQTEHHGVIPITALDHLKP